MLLGSLISFLDRHLTQYACISPWSYPIRVAPLYRLHKERIVPIGKQVSIILGGYIQNVRPIPLDPKCNALFLTHNGKPITTNTLKLLFSRLANKSGVQRLHAHLCRHTFATDYLYNGGDIHSLKEILGHTTLDMVNEYLHFTSSQITDLHHKFSPMDRFLNPENEGEDSDE